jgi:5-methylcytosine-specific restriction protein A
MPTILKACRFPGCPAVAAQGSGYCAEHLPVIQAQRDQDRPTARQRGYDSRWQKLRLHHLKHFPLCKSCGRAGQEVDHILPLRKGGTHHPSNLQTLCKSCHSRKTMKESVRRTP